MGSGQPDAFIVDASPTTPNRRIKVNNANDPMNETES